MNKEQKNKLSELLEAVKKTDNDKIHIEAENDGLWNGVGVIIFEKGEHQIVYYRNFELFSQTLEMISNEKVEILCEYIDNCLNENNYNLLIEGISEGSFGNNYDNDWEVFNTSSYELNDELQSHSMDDEEIPEEILDDDGDIDSSKLEDNGWEFGILGGGTSFYNVDSTEYEDLDIDLKSVTIQVDDKIFTFVLD